MSLFNQLKTDIEVLAVIVAFAAAAFWFEAANINPPWAAMGTMGGPPPDVLQQLRRQSKLNARAALLTGISALLQWIALAVWS